MDLRLEALATESPEDGNAPPVGSFADFLGRTSFLFRGSFSGGFFGEEVAELGERSACGAGALVVGSSPLEEELTRVESGL